MIGWPLRDESRTPSVCWKVGRKGSPWSTHSAKAVREVMSAAPTGQRLGPGKIGSSELLAQEGSFTTTFTSIECRAPPVMSVRAAARPKPECPRARRSRR